MANNGLADKASSVKKALLVKQAAHLPALEAVELLRTAQESTGGVAPQERSISSFATGLKSESLKMSKAPAARSVTASLGAAFILGAILAQIGYRAPVKQELLTKIESTITEHNIIDVMYDQGQDKAPLLNSITPDIASSAWREHTDVPSELLGAAWGTLAAINDTWILHTERQFLVQEELHNSTISSPLAPDVQDMAGSMPVDHDLAQAPEPEPAATCANASYDSNTVTPVQVVVVPYAAEVQSAVGRITSIDFIDAESSGGAATQPEVRSTLQVDLTCREQAQVAAAPVQQQAAVQEAILLPAHAAQPKDSSKSSKRRKQKEKEQKAKEEKKRKAAALPSTAAKAVPGTTEKLQSNLPAVPPSLFSPMWTAESKTATMSGLRAVGVHPASEAAWQAAMHSGEAPLDPALMASMYIQVAFNADVRVHPITSRLCVTVLSDPPQRSDGLDAAHACLTPPMTKQYVAAQQAAASSGKAADVPVFRLTGLAANTAYRVQMLMVDMRGNGHKASSTLFLQEGEPGVLQDEGAGLPQLLQVFQGVE